MDKARPAKDLVAQIQTRDRRTDDAMRAGWLGRHLSGRIAVEQIVVDELPIARLSTGRADDAAVVDTERFDRSTEPRRSGIEIDRTGFSTRMAQSSARLLHRQAARGDRLVGTHRCRRRHHAHLVERDVEFFRHDLRQRGQDSLADLDFAREYLDVSFDAELEPLREPPIYAQAPGRRRGGNCATREIEGRIHATSRATAARSTARTIRL